MNYHRGLNIETRCFFEARCLTCGWTFCVESPELGYRVKCGCRLWRVAAHVRNVGDDSSFFGFRLEEELSDQVSEVGFLRAEVARLEAEATACAARDAQ